MNSLDARFNTITNSSDIARILKALTPEIQHLDLSNNSPNGLSPDSPRDFLGLGRLTGLQSFNISNNLLSPGDIGVIGQALQNLSLLKELRLGGNVDLNNGYSNTNIAQIAQSLKPPLTLLDLTGFGSQFDLAGQIALGNSLNQTTNLRQLYLGGTGIGGAFNATVALAQGLSAQQNLRILDLSSNNLFESTDSSTLFIALPPSLTHLDVSFNSVVIYPEIYGVHALARAVYKMSELVSFKIDSSFIENSPRLIKCPSEKTKIS